MLAAIPAVAQDFSEIKLEKIATGMKYAEGPAWSTEGFLIFSDTAANKQLKLTLGRGKPDSEDATGGAIGHAYDSQGRLYTCEFRERRVTRTDKTGKMTVVAARFNGKRFNAPNDIVVRHDGHVYFTDPAFGNQQDTQELDFNGVFHVTPKGEVEAIAKWKTRPNGIALSPNGKILYVTDSDAKLIRAYDLDHPGEGRVLVEHLSGVPDGVRIDEKGNLWVAADAVYCYSAQGKLLGEIRLPEVPSNLAFGDGDLETLFITARTSLYRVKVGVKGVIPN